MGKRVLVCGGRHYGKKTKEKILFYSTMGEYMESLHGRITTIIHGGASGADTMAKSWAIAHELEHIEVAADWETFGRSAGPRRNQRMLDEFKPDMVIAFPGGRGTADMVKRAEAAGLLVEIPLGGVDG